MKRILVIAAGTVITMVGWVVLVFIGASEGWLRDPVTTSRTADAYMAAAEQIIDEESDGNIAMTYIRQGKMVSSHYQSAGEPVGPDTVFQVASLSKWISAWGVMALVEDGKLDLDAPVSQYLTRWQLPQGAFDNDGVTVRRLLSHTAGLDDGLGYAGFDRAADVQSLEDSLTRASDASPGKNGVVRVASEPGSQWEYSGGGYTLLQLLIEEVSGQSFGTFMQQRIFGPLGMEHSGFDHDAAMALGLAENYDANGRTEPLKRFTSLAATSLYTTAHDLTLFVQAQSPQTSAGQTRILSDKTLREMRKPHGAQLGADIWGLGTMLYAANNQGDFIIGHDGNNEPAINSSVRLDPDTGDGIVILQTGNPLLATRLAGEWVFWKTGNVDFLMLSMQLDRMIQWMIYGSLAILLIGLVCGWRYRRPRQS
ncbi:CubicO group peptidase, beta-lactamase class C family [Parasphingorhabdus marina DSM 22363]|uniref:CubicO group peptidase, beta-lactamase class C family n=1 Tax=Parasphingorhabdus marina DSM 22363 TaxID=1123272 RepID=A0A1N6H2R9_9SPHN|nr:serine hydrolase domain-containing protein [Parasphingorhabdus marina]SIO13992.1 CubicO group peptidase, beta-lactamase class C family [Parasphingorhabdus marina DSM 22363]